ncbi:MAG: hypothetical protein JJT75_07975 [Opitutales bacterium]|nr:hypothetical protein [Opitutales bacterium]
MQSFSLRTLINPTNGPMFSSPRHFYSFLLLLGFGFFFGPALSAEDTLPVPQKLAQLRVQLEGLFQRGSDAPARGLVLEFNHLNDHWFMGSGYFPSYNQGIHRAILSPKDGDDLGRLEIDAIIEGDAWVPGGDLHLRIEWNKDGENRYRGHYSGTALGNEVEGVATGIYFPAPEPLPDATAAQRGEHPRLLFRAEDLPALREKAETEFGKRALARAGDEVSVLRSILVDKGGRAGVPMVMVIHDQLQGVDSPLWTWPLHTENAESPSNDEKSPKNAYSRSSASDDRIEIVDHGFTRQQGEARLRGTFLFPETVSVALEDIQQIRPGSRTLRHRVISAEGSKEEFLAVITLGEGSPPEVKRFEHPDGIGIQVGEARYLLVEGELQFLP